MRARSSENIRKDAIARSAAAARWQHPQTTATAPAANQISNLGGSLHGRQRGSSVAAAVSVVASKAKGEMQLINVT